MKTYKHYSFDLWLTLIRSNPQFKTERAMFFHKNLNPLRKSMEEVQLVFRHVDLMCNSINQKTGGNIDSREMYLMVISMLAGYDTDFNDIDIEEVERTMEELFFSFAPVFYSPDTKNTLDRIRQKGDTSINILSNTAFIKGSLLRKLMSRLDISELFDFQLYSDETGMSKPNGKFFRMMLDKAATSGIHHNIKADEIIHIGDNLEADIKGASAAGIHSFHIHTGNNTILNLIP
jgi:putative hydrolase of the HAD superfamily